MERCQIKTKKWFAGGLVGLFFIMLVLRYAALKSPFGESPVLVPNPLNSTDRLESRQDAAPPTVQPQESASDQVISADTMVSSLFLEWNFSHEVQRSLLPWNSMKHLINYSQGLPNAVEAIREAKVAWDNLMDSFGKEQNGDTNGSFVHKVRGKQCPHFLSNITVTSFGDTGYRLRIPCVLVQGSSITIIGIPNGLLGDFRIDLAGEPLQGEPDPPIVLHYNVRLHGDKITENPVIVQNTWTAADDWDEEKRCPLPDPSVNKKVDDLKQCNEMVGNNEGAKATARNNSKASQHFPFKQGYLAVMTLRVGEEGIHMTVDGKHITSFAFREILEPWLVSEVRISGEMELLSVLASGLPTSEGLDEIVDLEELRSVPLPLHHRLDLFIGVFSTANNFKRRMAVRRAWSTLWSRLE